MGRERRLGVSVSMEGFIGLLQEDLFVCVLPSFSSRSQSVVHGKFILGKWDPLQPALIRDRFGRLESGMIFHILKVLSKVLGMKSY